MPEMSKPETVVQIVSCSVEDISALLPFAERYYQEDHLVFDAARFERALTAALMPTIPGSSTLPAQGPGCAFWLCVAGVRAGYALMMDGWSIEFGGLISTLDEIYVLPAWRGKGVASQAIIALRDQLIARGGVSMNLETTPNNFQAQKLYRRLGFDETQRPVFRISLNQA